MKRFCAAALVAVGLFSSCQPVSNPVVSRSAQSAVQQNSSNAVSLPATQSKICWNSQISLPIPAPNASSYIGDSYSEIECVGSRRKDLDDYCVTLKKAGWKEVGIAGASSGSGPLKLTYIKGNDVVSLMDQTFEAPTSYVQPSIRIYYGSGYHGGYSDGRKTPEQAKPMFQKYINGLKKDNYMSGKIISGVTETDIGDAYKKMGLQCFCAYCTNNGSDTFLLGKNNSITEAWIHHFCTADIDGDGRDEFLSMVGVGSGIYRIILSAYQYDKNGALKIIYSNCWVPKLGYDDLTIVKVDEKTVKLYGIKKGNGKYIPDPNKDYGALKVSGKKLVCQSADFPFREMN